MHQEFAEALLGGEDEGLVKRVQPHEQVKSAKMEHIEYHKIVEDESRRKKNGKLL